MLWYSKVKTITLSLDSFFSADSDNEIVIIETSFGYLSAISITDYYHICSLCLLTENDMILKMRAKQTWKGRKLNFKPLLWKKGRQLTNPTKHVKDLIDVGCFYYILLRSSDGGYTDYESDKICMENDSLTETEIFIQDVYGIIILEINNHYFIEGIFKSVESKYMYN